MPIFKTKNENFFKNWGSDMAYVLGFIIADGCVIKNKRGACFLEISSNENYSRRYRLQIGSKKIFKNLLNLGIYPRKSKTIKLPVLPDKYFSHFLRGYFDGDGCVNICKFKRKDRKSFSYVLTSVFTSGSRNILVEIKNKLQELEVIKGGSFFYNQGYRLSFSINDSLGLYGFMYRNLKNNLYLNRKKSVFEKYLTSRK
jgi:hypothetical protein